MVVSIKQSFCSQTNRRQRRIIRQQKSYHQALQVERPHLLDVALPAMQVDHAARQDVLLEAQPKGGHPVHALALEVEAELNRLVIKIFNRVSPIKWCSSAIGQQSDEKDSFTGSPGTERMDTRSLSPCSYRLSKRTTPCSIRCCKAYFDY